MATDTQNDNQTGATKYADIFAALAAPFQPDEVKFRTQGGRQLSYVTARTVQNRLDDILGPENWWTEFSPFGDHGVRCRLTVRMPDGVTVTKEDIGGYAGMQDQGDDEKSGVSDSLKRAAVCLGVARYLYRDGVPGFVYERFPNIAPPDAESGAYGGNQSRGGGVAQRGTEHGQGQTQRQDGGGTKQYDGPPKSGRALFAWVKDQEQKYEVQLLRYLNQWGHLQDMPGRMVDWDESQVKLAYDEAVRKLKDFQTQAVQ